jgi:hemerythrin
MPIKWKNEYSVNVEEIDGQHKEYLKLVNELYDAINTQKTRENLSKIIGRLIEYADFHFSTEEKYFREFKYPLAKEHIIEHRKFSEKMDELSKKHKNKEIEISFELVDYLEDWLVDHLAKQDKKYTKCFNDNGLY